ncbi:MAG: hypothetical protein WB676_14675 [Bryobacteraceae bacterium]
MRYVRVGFTSQVLKNVEAAYIYTHFWLSSGFKPMECNAAVAVAKYFGRPCWDCGRLYIRQNLRQQQNRPIASDPEHRLWKRNPQPRSVGADKGYDTRDFVETVRAMGVRAHVCAKFEAPWRKRHRCARDQARLLRTEPVKASAD